MIVEWFFPLVLVWKSVLILFINILLFKENHPDLVIPKKLTELVGKSFQVFRYSSEVDPILKEVYKNSVDYARDRTAAMILSGNGTYFKDAIMLNGNLGEIARSYYNYTENVSGRGLRR